jgi:tetratricopeptide (TPR) repeat protein
MGRVFGVMSYIRRELGDLDGAMAAGQQALTIAVELRDPVQKAEASYRLAQAVHTMGDSNRAAELLRENVEALSLDGPSRSRGLAVDSRAWLARVASSLGEFAEGNRHGQEAVRLAMAEGRGSSPITAHGCLGILCVAKGDWEAAIRLLEAGLALCRAADDRNWSQAITGALGEAYGHVGRLPESLALLEEALNAAVQSRALTLQGSHARQLSVVNLLAGRPDEAWRHGCQALDLARQLKARGNEATALFQLGAVHAQTSYSPDVEQAVLRYREALALAEPRGMRPLIAHCHLGLGKLYRRTGERERSELHLRIAATLYREMDMTFWVEQVQAEAREPVGVKAVVDGG